METPEVSKIIGGIEYHLRSAEIEYKFAQTLPQKTKVHIAMYEKANAKVNALRLCYNIATGESNTFPLYIHQ